MAKTSNKKQSVKKYDGSKVHVDTYCFVNHASKRVSHNYIITKLLQLQINNV